MSGPPQPPGGPPPRPPVMPPLPPGFKMPPGIHALPKPPQPYSPQPPPSGYPHQPPPSGYPHQPPSSGYPHQPPPSGYPHQPPSSGYPHQSPSSGYPHQPPSSGYPHQPPQSHAHPQTNRYAPPPDVYAPRDGRRPLPPPPHGAEMRGYAPGPSPYVPYHPEGPYNDGAPMYEMGDRRGGDRYARGMGMGMGMGGGRHEVELREPTNTVWVGNLDAREHSEDILRREFREFGRVMRIAKVPDKSYCFVHFRRVEEARHAVETLSARGTLGRARFNYGKMFEYSQEDMEIPYDPSHRPPRRVREEDPQEDPRRRRPRREEERMEEPTNVLWVGGIPPTVSIEELQENFKVFGTISNVSRLDGRNMAFIHFETVESCSQALELMRDQLIGGARVSLNYGRAQRAPTGPEELSADGIPLSENQTNVVYLGQFASDVTEEDIENLFEPYEGFINCKLIQSSGIAFGHFDTVENARVARVGLNHALLRGAPMRISFGKSNHNLTMADRMRHGRPAPLGGPTDAEGLGAGSGDAPTGTSTLDGMAGALIAGPGVSSADGNGFGGAALVTLPAMGAMVGAVVTPQAPNCFARERPTPEMTLDARLQSLLGTTYNNSGEAEKALSPSMIQTFCDLIDECVDEKTEKQLDEAIFLYTPLNAAHVFAILAKRMYEFFNDDPHKKLLILYAATRVLLGAKTDYIFFTKASLNAYLMTLFVASEGQTPGGMELFTSIVENVRRHPFLERQKLDADFIEVFREQLDDLLRRTKVDQDLASLMTRKKRR